MRTALIQTLKLGLFCLLATMAVPAQAEAGDAPFAAPLATSSETCSGDDCGCYIEADQCIADCNGNQTCMGACRTAARRCAICCCCPCEPWNYCPTYCGCPPYPPPASTTPDKGAPSSSPSLAELFPPFVAMSMERAAGKDCAGTRTVVAETPAAPSVAANR